MERNTVDTVEALYPNLLFGFILFFVLVFVLLDGFDLGIGIVTLFTKDPAVRNRLTALIAPFWDGNEVWLIMAGGCFFGAFSIAFSVLIPALYLPITLVVFSLIVRAVALEFSYQDVNRTYGWQTLFGLGSLGAAFLTLTALGALLQGLPFTAPGVVSGSLLDYFTPFTLVFALIGTLLLVIHGMAYGVTQSDFPEWTRWQKHLRRLPVSPLVWTSLAFVALWAGSIAKVWPYILPSRTTAAYGFTVMQAAAPLSTLRSLFNLIVVATPIILFCTLFVYRTFRKPLSHSTAAERLVQSEAEASQNGPIEEVV